MSRRRFSKMQRASFTLILALGLVGTLIGIASAPRTTPNYRVEAQGHFKAGAFRAAVAAMDRALDMAPEEFTGRELTAVKAEMLTERGACNLQLGRPEHALQDLREARALQRSNPDTWMREGQAFLSLKRYNDAALLFEEAALAFATREIYFRYAAGCAHYSYSRSKLEQAQTVLLAQSSSKFVEIVTLETELFAAAAPNATPISELEELYLRPPHNNSERQTAYSNLLEARRAFLRADQLLEDYERASDLDPEVGIVRTEMHQRRGRLYEAKRLAELLLRSGLTDEPMQIRLRSLLANSYHDLNQYEDAAREFLELRRIHKKRKEIDEGRRALIFAIEELLRARNGIAALDLVDRLPAMREDDALVHFYTCYGLYLAGRVNMVTRSMERSIEVFQRDSWRSRWFRDDDHRQLVFQGLLECLEFVERWALATEVLGAALAYFPERMDWARKRAELLKKQRAREQDLVDQDLAILQSGQRRTEDLLRWENDTLDATRRRPHLEEEISYQARRIVRLYADDGKNDIRAALAQAMKFLKDPQARMRRLRGNTGPLQTGGHALLGGLGGDAFLALQVYRHLLKEGHRDQAYLLMFGLFDQHPDIVHFQFLLARHDYAEGRFEDAGDGFWQLYQANPSDFESARYAWYCYRHIGQVELARQIEAHAMKHDPTGAGKVFAMMATLADGYPGIAARIGDDAELAGEWADTLQGLLAQAQLALGRADLARSLALAVLERDATQQFALDAALRGLYTGNVDAEEDRGLTYLAERRESIEALPVEQLFEIGQQMLRQQFFSLADFVFRLGLGKDSHHVPIRLGLVDALLGLERYGEAGALLEQLQSHRQTLAESRRRGLLLFYSRSMDEVYTYIRSQTTTLETRQELHRWLTILGAATGRVSLAVRSLRGIRYTLPEDIARFLAVSIEVTKAEVASNDIPKELETKLNLLRGQGNPGERDREMEHWFSVAVADGGLYKLSEALVPVLLLRDLPDLEPLLSNAESRALAEYPQLGSIARDLAHRQMRRGKYADAVHELVTHVQHDPGDLESLRLITSWSESLTLAQVSKVLQSTTTRQIPAGMRLFLMALHNAGRGESQKALELLGQATQHMEDKSPALVAMLRLREHEVLRYQALPQDRGPYTNYAKRAGLLHLVKQLDQEVLKVAESYPNDDGVIHYIVEYLDRRHHWGVEGGPLLDTLTAALLNYEGSSWKAFRRVAALLAEESTDKVRIQQLASTLRGAIESAPETHLPLDGLEALLHLSTGLRRLQITDAADALLNLAESICPHYSKILLARAELSEAAGDPSQAVVLWERAVASGEKDPEVLLRLADQELSTRQDFERASALAGEALQTPAPAPSAEQRARALRIRSRVAYLRNDFTAARQALEQACAAVGRKSNEDLDLALQSYASGDLQVARRCLMNQSRNEELEQQPLASRLLATITSSSDREKTPRRKATR